MKLILISFLLILGLPHAKDWEFSKDTVFKAQNSVKKGLVRDSVYLVNHTSEVILFESGTFEILNNNGRFCRNHVTAIGPVIGEGENARSNIPFNKFVGEGLPFDTMATGLESFRLAKKSNSTNFQFYFEAGSCDVSVSPTKIIDSNLIVRVIFVSKDHGADTLLVRGDNIPYGFSLLAPIRNKPRSKSQVNYRSKTKNFFALPLDGRKEKK